MSDAEVARSNAIMERLRATARAYPDLRDALARLPMYRVAAVGGVTHRDRARRSRIARGLGLLAGSAGRGGASCTVARQFERANVRVIASSHTCLPVATDFETALGRGVLINNGAAGMPNFRGTHYGVITRIALSPAPDALYGSRIGPLYVDALPVHHDHDAWVRAFCRAGREARRLTIRITIASRRGRATRRLPQFDGAAQRRP